MNDEAMTITSLTNAVGEGGDVLSQGVTPLT